MAVAPMIPTGIRDKRKNNSVKIPRLKSCCGVTQSSLGIKASSAMFTQMGGIMAGTSNASTITVSDSDLRSSREKATVINVAKTVSMATQFISFAFTCSLLSTGMVKEIQ